MRNFRNRLANASKKENGASDAISMLILLPILLMLIFSMIDISLYVMARSNVQGIARDGARQVAMWGGESSTLRGKAAKPSANMKNALQHNDGSCKPSACQKGKPPTVKCTPARTSNAGQEVSCTITYYYQSVVGNFSFFGAITNSPFTVKQYAYSETKGLK